MFERSRNWSIGAFGEILACRYLKSKGFTIIERNYLFPNVGEIDIIAFSAGTLYFVEVKSSESYSITDEHHSVAHFDGRKKDRVLKAMRKYCDVRDITIARTMSLLSVSFSRETKKASIQFEPFVFIDSI